LDKQELKPSDQQYPLSQDSLSQDHAFRILHFLMEPVRTPR